MSTSATPTTGLVGNLTGDPELRYSAAGKPWTKARLSVQPYDPDAAEKPEPVFYDLVCFGSLAENVATVCRKGDRVAVSGRLEDDTWTGRDGSERVTQRIVAEAIGPDLRFGTVEINRSRRGESKPQSPTSAAPARSYQDDPF
jgi:single-strand DNA-binding protein